MKHFISGNLVAFDTECTGLSPWKGDRPFAFSFCNASGDTAYFEWPVDPFSRTVKPNKKEAQQVRDFLRDEKITKIGHNLTFDVQMCHVGMGWEVCGPGGLVWEGGECHETQFSYHVCSSDEISLHLKRLSQAHLDIPTDDEKDLKTCVQRLRRKAQADDWKIGFEFIEQPDGSLKKKAATTSDYWIPFTASLLRPEWLRPGEKSLCRKYAVKDAERTMLSHLYNMRRLEDLGTYEVYRREMELWQDTYRMIHRGVCVDVKKLNAMSEEAKRKQEETYATIENTIGWKGINLRSPPQVAKMLFDKNGIQGGKAGRSTSKVALENLHNDPVVSLLLRYRKYEKARSSFFNKYKSLGVSGEVPGCLVLHAGFRQLGPATGRWACSSPNLQQVANPESARYGSGDGGVLPVRESFRPRPGHVWTVTDYQGQEINIIADSAQEPTMLKAIREGKDVHSIAAASIFSGANNPMTVRQAVWALDLESGETWSDDIRKVWKELGVKTGKRYDAEDRARIASLWLSQHSWDIQAAEKSIGRKNTRSHVKQTTFGKVYGGEADTLARTLRIPIEDAEQIWHTYDTLFPRIIEWQREMVSKAVKDGFVLTRWDRKLQVDPYRAYTTAVNYHVQGTASDLLKHCMRKVEKWWMEEEIRAGSVMVIHDEHDAEWHEDDFTLKNVIKYGKLMSDSDGHIGVPMPVSPLLVTESWQHHHKIKGYKYP